MQIIWCEMQKNFALFGQMCFKAARLGNVFASRGQTFQTPGVNHRLRLMAKKLGPFLHQCISDRCVQAPKRRGSSLPTQPSAGPGGGGGHRKSSRPRPLPKKRIRRFAPKPISGCQFPMTVPCWQPVHLCIYGGPSFGCIDSDFPHEKGPVLLWFIRGFPFAGV